MSQGRLDPSTYELSPGGQMACKIIGSVIGYGSIVLLFLVALEPLIRGYR